jgi:hypothetical protein
MAGMDTPIHVKTPARLGQKYVGIWMPISLLDALRQAARASNSDISKVMRAAVRERLSRMEADSPAPREGGAA